METVAECFLGCSSFYKVETPDKTGDIEQQPNKEERTIQKATRTEEGYPCPRCGAPLRIIGSLQEPYPIIYLREKPRE